MKVGREKLTVKTPVIVAIVVVIFWGINWCYGLSIPEEQRGVFGDMFGAVNALFSGLALAGVIYAILMQRIEVRLTKEELIRTKKIFEKQSGSLELQNKETQKQIFENTFFQLLRVFTEITENLDLVSNGAQTTRGKDVLSVFEGRLERIANGLKKEGVASPNHDQVYSKFYSQHQNDLGHYFRMLYTTLKFVDDRAPENGKFYTNILRAQLSNSELHLLLYNGLSAYGVEKLKPMLEKYEFFDNLPIQCVAYKDALSKYREPAFGQNYQIKNYILEQMGL